MKEPDRLRILRQPLLWLLVQAAGAGLVCWWNHGFVVEFVPDSSTYLDTDLSSPRAAFSEIRTLGYPLLLAWARVFSPSLGILPYIHFLLFLSAVFLLYSGLRSYGFAPVMAFGAASTLFYCRFFYAYIPLVLADVAGLSLAIISIAFLAAAMGRGKSLAWIGFAVSLALTYHVRPAYLFLAPLAVLLGTSLYWLLPYGARKASSLRVSLALCLAVAAPLLLYCGLRWSVVGHFGLVSFGGYNLVGITTQFLAPELVAELPESERELAFAILEKQRQTPSWQPLPEYSDILRQYNDAIWRIAIPVAQELHGADPVVVNQRLQELSKAILLRRPKMYGVWLKTAFKEGLVRLAALSWLERSGIALLAGLAFCAGVETYRRANAAARRPPTDQVQNYFIEYHAVVLIGVGFALAKMALVILVEPPLDRYLAPAAVFLPMFLAVALIDRVLRIFPATEVE